MWFFVYSMILWQIGLICFYQTQFLLLNCFCWWCPLLFICVEGSAYWTRLRDLIVYVSDTTDDYNQTENICRIFQGYVFDDGTERIRYFDCVAQKAGRYVQLINSPNNFNCFHLSEVEVFGCWDNQENGFIEQKYINVKNDNFEPD